MLSVIHPENLFFEETRLLSKSARFGLGICFLNEFCDRFSVSGEAFDQFCEHAWTCPMLQEKGNFAVWHSNQSLIVADGLSETQGFGSNGVSSPSTRDFARYAQIFDLTFGVLEIFFWSASDNEGTYKLLARVAKLARQSMLPATTPFKFSSIEDNDGWGAALTASDLQFWRSYSENWFRMEEYW